MQSRTDTRNLGNAGHPGAFAMNTAMYNSLNQGPLQYCLSGAPYTPMQRGEMSRLAVSSHAGANEGLEDMTAAFGNLSVNNYNTNGGAAGNGAYWMPGIGGVPESSSSSSVQYRLRDGRVLQSQMGNNQSSYQSNGNGLSFQQAQYLPQALGYSNGNGVHASTQAMAWNGAQQYSRETPVPDLAAPRRNSLSSNEENGPHTPFFGAGPRTDFQPKVALAESPQAWTPSPQQLVTYIPDQLLKSPNGQYMRMDLDSICLQDPSIPKPVPAIFSGEKGRGTLEKSLQNNLNTTNVYIRGLHPNTTDDMLKSYGLRFGDIVSAKSMLDQETGNCKGFGFIKYHNFVDGENCIRAFFHWGYEAKWARVSHNEKLKTLGDENNTNLYVSNLPLDFNEHTLMATFNDYEVLSAKILRDGNGLSRGVGFARFASPEICKKIIDEYNGKKVGDDGATLSIRFADTPKQKELKTITAERRNYKAHEYNTAVYSPGSPYLTSTAATTIPSPLASRASVSSGNYWPSQTSQVSSVYASYPVSSAAYHSPAMSAMTSFKVAGTENIAPASRQADRGRVDTPDAKSESPSAAALKRSSLANIQSPVKSEGDGVSGKCYIPASQADAKSSPIKPTKYTSPAKSTPSKVNLLRL